MSDFMEITSQPNSKEAEEAVLGSILLNPESYRSISPFINEDDFYVIRNQWIFSCIEDMIRKHIEIDILTVSQKLQDENKLSDIGGQQYLVGLINNTPTSMHGEHYAKIVQNLSKRRNMLSAANGLAKNAYDLENDIDEVIPSHISTILKSLKTENKTERLSVGLGKLWDDIQKRRDSPKEIFGLSTGINKLDEVTGGIQKMETFMISGEPGLGKSLLSIQIAFSMAKAGHAGIIYELEMGQLNTLRRSLSNESRVEARAMKTGYVNDSQMSDIGEAISRMEQLPIFISNSTSWTTAGIRADITRLKQEHCIEWFLVDYLGKLKDKYNGKEFERIGLMGSALHDTCMELNVAGILIHTMNKAGYTDNPGMEALSGDTKTGYDPDVAVFLTKNETREYKNKNVINLSFGKFREGSTNQTIKLSRHANFPQFEPLIENDQFKEREVKQDYRTQ
jgi:replicative DNA helicase